MKIYDYNLNEWYNIVEPILSNGEFQKRKTFLHHGNITVYEHVLCVSIVSYKWAKKMGLNYRDAAIAGLLHDFYKTPWTTDTEKKPLFKKHGFTHASDALDNAKTHFNDLLNPVIENTILRHMFPLNIIPPKYKIGWIVTLADKRVSLEVMFEPKFFRDLITGVTGR